MQEYNTILANIQEFIFSKNLISFHSHPIVLWGNSSFMKSYQAVDSGYSSCDSTTTNKSQLATETRQFLLRNYNIQTHNFSHILVVAKKMPLEPRLPRLAGKEPRLLKSLIIHLCYKIPLSYRFVFRSSISKNPVFILISELL